MPQGMVSLKCAKKSLYKYLLTLPSSCLGLLYREDLIVTLPNGPTGTVRWRIRSRRFDSAINIFDLRVMATSIENGFIRQVSTWYELSIGSDRVRIDNLPAGPITARRYAQLFAQGQRYLAFALGGKRHVEVTGFVTEDVTTQGVPANPVHHYAHQIPALVLDR